jgi:hypothetical protein
VASATIAGSSRLVVDPDAPWSGSEWIGSARRVDGRPWRGAAPYDRPMDEEWTIGELFDEH